MLTSAAASQSARSMRTSTRCSLTMPHPSRSSGGIKIASHFLSLLLSQDWHAQLCPESNTNPWSHGHLPKLIHQNTVSRFPFKTGSGILRGTTMRLSWRIRILTCMWGMSLQQVTGWQIEANSMTFLFFLHRVESQLDYWREDPMLHAFHSILHHAWCLTIFPMYLFSGKDRLTLKRVNSRVCTRHFGLPTDSSWKGGTFRVR